MTYNLIFNSNISKECCQKLRDLFNSHCDNFEKYLPDCDDVDVYFEKSKKIDNELNKNQKLWGQAHLRDRFILFVIYDEDFSESDFCQNIYHESAHAYRGFYEKNDWLMPDICSEGQAVNFEKQIRDELDGIWWDDLPWYYFEKEKDMILARLREAIEIYDNKTNYNYDAWMYNFDGQNPDFVKNLGYKIGDFLVGEYCKFYNKKPSEVLRTPTQEFVKFAKKDILCEK